MTIIIRVVDVETTGLDPAVDRIVEIGTIDLIIDSDVEITRGEIWSTLINPQRPIPPDASAIHDITDEMVTDAPLVRDVIDHILRGPPQFFAAHNSRSDKSFIDPSPTIPWIDTYRVALVLWPDSPSHSNQCLRYFLNLKLADNAPPKHRAAGDAYITAAILRRALGQEMVGHPDDPAYTATLQRFVEISTKPAQMTKLPFGKHAGVVLAQVPTSYLEWIMKQEEMNEDARYTAFNELNRRRSA